MPSTRGPNRDVSIKPACTRCSVWSAAPRAKAPYEPILGVFPDRLQPGSFLEYRWADSGGVPQSRRIERPAP
jgi:hypothetical protein